MRSLVPKDLERRKKAENDRHVLLSAAE